MAAAPAIAVRHRRAELLAELAELGQALDRWAPSTTRTHDSYWNTWQAWATERGFNALPASAEHLVESP